MDTLAVGIISCILTFNILSATSSDTELINKRRPGWGKRDIPGVDENLEDFSEPDKRAPGWGKRESEYLDNEIDKRRPGWGKRSDILEKFPLFKRRPGWGKRTVSDILDLDKRKPGWGKRDMGGLLMERRAPGWGKRTVDLTDEDLMAYDKRRPGWGKRADDIEIETRRPGWGKRAPGWGKRSSLLETCLTLEEEANHYFDLAIQAETKRASQCGVREDILL